MITTINTSNYKRVESINLNGLTFTSSYNHNYFYDKNNDELILEEADDYQTCFYYRVNINENLEVSTDYIGYTDDQYGFGIFDDDYEGYPYRNENNFVEFNSNNK